MKFLFYFNGMSDFKPFHCLRFRNSGLKYRGVPVMAANMDTTGTFSIARAFSPHKMFVCIHKHYSVQQWVEFAANNPDCVEVSASFSVLEFRV